MPLREDGHSAAVRRPGGALSPLRLALAALLLYLPLAAWTMFLFGSGGGGGTSGALPGARVPPASAAAAAERTTERELRDLRDRLEYLETKVNAYLSFGTDPFLGMKKRPDSSSLCRRPGLLEEYCREDVAGPDDDDPDRCAIDHAVCLDGLLAEGRRDPCVVYDFGVRAEPEFGEVLVKPRFNCTVFAFDPSEVTKKWYVKSPLRRNPSYKLFPYGAGGIDGVLALREYNWNQITIYQYPHQVIDSQNCDDRTCKFKRFSPQKTFEVPVKTLRTIMKRLGHERITVLKLDIEGSEYSFLEAMIDDLSCRRVDQLTVEWHHHGFDHRYGMASSPHINVLVSLLDKRCGLKQFEVYDTAGGWPANNKIYMEMGLTLRYNLASFIRKD